MKKAVFGLAMLAMIFCIHSTKVSATPIVPMLPKDILETDITRVLDDFHTLAAVMQLENGDASDRVLELTGCVVLNRVASKSWPNTIHDVIFQGYNEPGPQQYATYTIKRLNTVKISTRTYQIAANLWVNGVTCPSNVVYQSRNSKNGSSIYYTEKGEYFAYQ